MWHARCLFLHQESKLGLLHWEHRVLTAGPTGKSLHVIFNTYLYEYPYVMVLFDSHFQPLCREPSGSVSPTSYLGASDTNCFCPAHKLIHGRMLQETKPIMFVKPPNTLVCRKDVSESPHQSSLHLLTWKVMSWKALVAEKGTRDRQVWRASPEHRQKARALAKQDGCQVDSKQGAGVRQRGWKRVGWHAASPEAPVPRNLGIISTNSDVCSGPEFPERTEE